EMDDFSAKPGAPNVYGLIGGQANAIAPGKRMLSSMAPTMVFKDGKLALVIGASGGARIISALVQVISNLIDHGLGIVRAVGASRVHHQWLPDRLFMEKGINSQIVKELKLKGHKTAISRRLGITNSIWVDPISGQAQAAPDPRGQGASAGF
ncbi:MAG: gamma-glutamyltransferase, partial [Thermodesulfobacteriota bacterium]